MTTRSIKRFPPILEEEIPSRCIGDTRPGNLGHLAFVLFGHLVLGFPLRTPTQGRVERLIEDPHHPTMPWSACGVPVGVPIPIIITSLALVRSITSQGTDCDLSGGRRLLPGERISYPGPEVLGLHAP